MTVKRRIVTEVNRVLARLDIEIAPVRSDEGWDGYFRRWIEEAKATGRDPNDIGDSEWGEDELAIALDRWYLPLAKPGSRIVELGPGSGRLTRHLVASGATVTVVDRSAFVCDWISSYLPGVGVRQSQGCRLPVQSASADAFFAHGVFEHLHAEEVYWFLLEGARVLKPGGNVVFNFDNVASSGGLDNLARSSSPDQLSPFRHHHPDAIAAIARRIGYSEVVLETSESRTAFAVLTL